MKKETRIVMKGFAGVILMIMTITVAFSAKEADHFRRLKVERDGHKVYCQKLVAKYPSIKPTYDFLILDGHIDRYEMRELEELARRQVR